MTRQVEATAHWRALDREGEDTCRLFRAEHGWILIGHARFRDEAGFAALDYVVRCDEGWYTLSADVTGLHEGREVNLRFSREHGRWRMNGRVQPQVDVASDIDLSFTPATNLMPLRRLASSDISELPLRAAWLRYPEERLGPLDQTYGKTGSYELVAYSAQQTGYSTQLCVDQCGFVTLYPGHWEGEVSHAS